MVRAWHLVPEFKIAGSGTTAADGNDKRFLHRHLTAPRRVDWRWMSLNYANTAAAVAMRRRQFPIRFLTKDALAFEMEYASGRNGHFIQTRSNTSIFNTIICFGSFTSATRSIAALKDT